MTDALPILLVALPAALAAGWALAVGFGRHRSVDAATASLQQPEREAAGAALRAARLRAQALEVAAEPVLIVWGDGKLRDCNAAALILLARHRTEVVNLDASAVRTLVEPSGTALDWHELVGRRAPWSGDAHIRMPDGSRTVASARVVPVFGDLGEVSAMVEVYRGDQRNGDPAADRFLRAIDTSDRAGDGEEPYEGARRELHLLALAFADVEKVLRQYELLLPAMRAEDPLSEAIAGLAAETSDLAASADVPRLLDEIPRVLERLRARVHALGDAAPDESGRVAAARD
jgi:hypothetical protein